MADNKGGEGRAEGGRRQMSVEKRALTMWPAPATLTNDSAPYALTLPAGFPPTFHVCSGAASHSCSPVHSIFSSHLGTRERGEGMRSRGGLQVN